MLVAQPYTPLRRRLNRIVTKCQRLLAVTYDPYRPELHYMRGPGPKWHAKHRQRIAHEAP